MNKESVSADTIIEQEVTKYLGSGEDNLEIGVSVGLVQGNTTTYFNSGLANRKKELLVASDTVFLIGSVQKVFTSTLCASQVVQGNMNLDGWLTDYLPMIKNGGAIVDVTPLNLATMTAGMTKRIPNAKGFHPGYALYRDEPPQQELITYWENFVPISTPGTKEKYSNVGVVTLGFATVGAAGVGYTVLLQDTITDPLEMPDTVVDITTIPCNRIAQGYKANGKLLKNRGVGLSSTAQDLVNFLRANLFLTEPLPFNLAEAMGLAHQPHFKKSSKKSIGLNWYIHDLGNDQTLITKGGGNSGFTAYLAFIPQQQLGVAMLSNGHPKPKNSTLGHAATRILTRLADVSEDLPVDLLDNGDEGEPNI